MTTPIKATIIATAVLVVLVVVAIVVATVTRPSAPDSAAEDGSLPGTRANTHVFDKVGQDVPTLVEFLDFECEACGAFYPVIEQLRETYKGKINYAIRYFPIPSHFNSTNAALAVEAAAKQGRAEDMYNKMYKTQTQWSEQQESKADVFRGFAEDLGLDMKSYDQAVADPATKKRVEQDYAEGQAMGVQGTPTFFLDGKKLTLTSLSDLTDALDRAIAD
ncbi:thioredoxin domain-containing protein [Leifsonia sp. NCR5]|uniref:DsbA family protein n=1 Tax=Leifsonia sp. NCR5 TaxID=1978342 RepID=UPI0015C47E20|nr:thioredoxin domain-containing protein [Leifsonia sp. NCR5]